MKVGVVVGGVYRTNRKQSSKLYVEREEVRKGRGGGWREKEKERNKDKERRGGGGVSKVGRERNCFSS